MTCKPATEARERADADYGATGERLFELFYQAAKSEQAAKHELPEIDTVDAAELGARLREHHRAFASKREARRAELQAIAHHPEAPE